MTPVMISIDSGGKVVPYVGQGTTRWSWSVVIVVSSVLDCEDCSVGYIGVAMTGTLGVILTAGTDCKQWGGTGG